jgi:hypothetical protein
MCRVSLGRFKQRAYAAFQRFHDREPVALITKKLRPPRNKIFSPAFRHKGIAGSATGTLGLGVGFHLLHSFLTGELSRGDQLESNWLLQGFARVAYGVYCHVTAKWLVVSIRIIDHFGIIPSQKKRG